MRSCGMAKTIVRSKVSVTEVVRQSHPDRVEVLICLPSDALKRVAQALAEGKMVGPPLTRISLDTAPAIYEALKQSKPDRKAVIVV